MNHIIEAVVELFEEEEWPFKLDQERSFVRMRVNGTAGDWSFAVEVEDGTLLMQSKLPVRVTDVRRCSCVEMLMRINATLKVGGFLLDFDEGLVVHHVTFPLAAESVPEQLRFLVAGSLATVDDYFSAIMSVVHAGTPPVEALSRLKGDTVLTKAGRGMNGRGEEGDNTRWRN